MGTNYSNRLQWALHDAAPDPLTPVFSASWYIRILQRPPAQHRPDPGFHLTRYCLPCAPLCAKPAHGLLSVATRCVKKLRLPLRRGPPAGAPAPDSRSGPDSTGKPPSGIKPAQGTRQTARTWPYRRPIRRSRPTAPARATLRRRQNLASTEVVAITCGRGVVDGDHRAAGRRR